MGQKWVLSSLRSEAPPLPAAASVFEGSYSACFADKVLQEIMVHLGKAWSLRYYSQVVDAKPEAEVF